MLFRFLFSSFIFCLSITNYCYAQPKMHLTEHRILLTETNPKYDYQFYNQGTSAAECTTQFIDFNVTANGQLRSIKNGNGPTTSAKALLRASPKRIRLEPNQAQKIKVIARNLRRQPNAEWVSYLSLRCKNLVKATDQKMQITPNFVFNIPVIVRKGQLGAKAHFSDVDILEQNNQQTIQFNLNREGNRSLYGRIDVLDESDNILTFVKGLSIYQQTQSLPKSLTLKNKASGKLKLRFVESEKFGNASASWTQP